MSFCILYVGLCLLLSVFLYLSAFFLFYIHLYIWMSLFLSCKSYVYKYYNCLLLIFCLRCLSILTSILCLSIRFVSVFFHIHLSVFASILSLFVSVLLSVCRSLFVFLSVWLSLCLFIHLSLGLCLFFFISLYIYVYPYVFCSLSKATWITFIVFMNWLINLSMSLLNHSPSLISKSNSIQHVQAPKQSNRISVHQSNKTSLSLSSAVWSWSVKSWPQRRQKYRDIMSW